MKGNAKVPVNSKSPMNVDAGGPKKSCLSEIQRLQRVHRIFRYHEIFLLNSFFTGS
jgi:hypothetical protein